MLENSNAAKTTDISLCRTQVLVMMWENSNNTHEDNPFFVTFGTRKTYLYVVLAKCRQHKQIGTTHFVVFAVESQVQIGSPPGYEWIESTIWMKASGLLELIF